MNDNRPSPEAMACVGLDLLKRAVVELVTAEPGIRGVEVLERLGLDSRHPASGEKLKTLLSWGLVNILIREGRVRRLKENGINRLYPGDGVQANGPATSASLERSAEKPLMG